GHVAAVAAEDEQVPDEGGRAAAAVDGDEALDVAPEDLAGQVEAGRALVAEVDEEPVAAHQRRRAGVAVLGVDARGGGARAEDLPVPEGLAGAGVQAEGAQRLAAAGGDGGGQVDAAAGHDRRGPAPAGDARLPGDVLVRPPLGGQAALDEALP